MSQADKDLLSATEAQIAYVKRRFERAEAVSPRWADSIDTLPNISLLRSCAPEWQGVVIDMLASIGVDTRDRGLRYFDHLEHPAPRKVDDRILREDA